MNIYERIPKVYGAPENPPCERKSILVHFTVVKLKFIYIYITAFDLYFHVFTIFSLS